jgi:hypothetical protein
LCLRHTLRQGIQVILVIKLPVLLAHLLGRPEQVALLVVLGRGGRTKVVHLMLTVGREAALVGIQEPEAEAVGAAMVLERQVLAVQVQVGRCTRWALLVVMVLVVG